MPWSNWNVPFNSISVLLRAYEQNWLTSLKECALSKREVNEILFYMYFISLSTAVVLLASLLCPNETYTSTIWDLRNHEKVIFTDWKWKMGLLPDVNHLLRILKHKTDKFSVTWRKKKKRDMQFHIKVLFNTFFNFKWSHNKVSSTDLQVRN